MMAIMVAGAVEVDSNLVENIAEADLNSEAVNAEVKVDKA